MSPPDASEAAEAATDQALRDENRSQERIAHHDPATCATCCGYEPWTRERRDRALTYAATARRRIIDLRVAS